MKKIKNLGVLLSIIIATISCTNDELIKKDFENKQLNENTSNLTAKGTNSFNTVYSTNSLVIKFESGVSDADKIFLRDYYEVLSYQLCEYCADHEIELWTFHDGIDIEPKKITIDDPSGGMHLPIYPYSYVEYVDYEFDFQIASTNTETKSSSGLNNLSSNGYQSYIKDTNDGVTIAVFDTGINPSAGGSSPIFQNHFLYNASNDGIPGIYSGWDFVNHDNDCSDDNIGLHGTAVSYIITDILNSNSYHIPHQILPLKVCNADGVASYFNFLCALNYALPRAEILNMSLGWYDDNSDDLVDNIFLYLLSQYPNAILINSAGNDNNDNDIHGHYPSGYPIDNVVAVASCNELFTDCSSFTNYGKMSVDFYAIGENIPFLGNNLNGTSFAAPKVTAMIAKQRFNNSGAPPYQITQDLLPLGFPYQGMFINNTKLTFYDRILNP